ncbi:MAG: protein kinase [candidate division Zixibacteria bacterium]
MVNDERSNNNTHSHLVLTTGTQINQYRIISKIGVGGMGEVYLAEDTELKRKVAFKFLPSSLVENEDYRARFKREAQAAARLNHPNIITVFEVGEFKNRPYFVMEYIEGRTLKDVIASSELDFEKSIELFIGILEGLEKAHSQGVNHRDIKPANIVLDGDGRPKLVDFGLAAVRGGEHITKSGSTLGTFGYMSPEQIQAKDIDHRSDIFSAGVLFYEMITGKRPFRGDNEATMINSILNDKPAPLSEHISNIPCGIEKIILKMLEKSPDSRYQNASEIINDLNELREGRGGGAARLYDWWNRYVVFGAVAILVVIIGYWAISELYKADKDAASQSKKMLAVLPFRNLGNPDDEYFADGMTEEIISRLVSVNDLGVISRTSARTFKITEKTLPEIANELKVGYVLVGTIRWDKTGDTDIVRITPQLIRVSDEMLLWAENYERPLRQIFSLQTEIAENIVNNLGITLGVIEDERLRTVPTENLEAYNYYLRAQFHLGKQTVEGFREGKTYLDRALQTDSNFALAWAGLAVYYTFSVTTGVISVDNVRSPAVHAARKALEKDSLLPEAHFVMGWVNSHLLRDWNAADKQFARALDLAPGNSTAHLAYASYLLPMNRTTEGLAEMEKAVMLDPLSPLVNQSMGWAYYITGQTGMAINQFKKTLEIDPTNIWAHTQLAWAYAYNDMYPQAVTECDLTLNELNPEFDPWLYASLGAVYAKDGDKNKARDILKLLEQADNEKYIDPFCFACLYANLNEPDSAWHWLEKAFDVKSPQLLFIKLPGMRDFFLKNISTDNRYSELIKKMKFP